MERSLKFLIFFAFTYLVLADFNKDWLNFKLEFNKNYENARIDGLRNEIYRLALNEINQYNAKKDTTYKRAADYTTDLTDSESFKKRGLKFLELPDDDWKEYKLKFKKSYDEKEDALRHTIFDRKVTSEIGVNQFTDLTEEEISRMG